MNLNQQFDIWFDATYPREQFGMFEGVARLGFREVAHKAFNHGLKVAVINAGDIEVVDAILALKDE